MTPIKQLIIASLIASTLSGCATAIIGGAAAGANSVANRRTIGTQFDDESTEIHILLIHAMCDCIDTMLTEGIA